MGYGGWMAYFPPGLNMDRFTSFYVYINYVYNIIIYIIISISISINTYRLRHNVVSDGTTRTYVYATCLE